MMIESKKNLCGLILLAGDILLMYGALFLALAFRYNDFSILPGPQTRQFLLHFSVLYVFWPVFLFAFDFYEPFVVRKKIAFFKNLALFFVIVFGIGALYFYLNSEALIMPKTILFLDVAIFSVLISLWRFLFYSAAGSGKFQKKIAVVGWRPVMDELVSGYFFRANYEIAGVFSANSFPGFEKIKIFSSQKDFGEFVNKHNIDQVIIAGKIDSIDLANGLLSRMALSNKFISLENFYEELSGKVSLNLINEIWIMEEISARRDGGYRIAKRIFDIVLSSLGLGLTVAIFPLIFLAVKFDSPGSVFYVQKRKGNGGREFPLYKFRTMKTASNQHTMWRGNDVSQVTRVGKMIKRMHIDEFPQFYNILKGDLSFVGPRPEWVKLAPDYEREIPFYQCRYLVRPGFTGWAQINYHASSTVKEAREKFEYDLYYIKNRSFILDIAIIAKTTQLFFR